MGMDDETGVGLAWASCSGPEVPRHWALFLDIDGTLLHIVETPQGVQVDSALCGLMGGLYGVSQGAVALISGRPIAEIDRLFTPMRLPAGGQHGIERRDAAGRMHRHPQPKDGLDRVRGWLAELQSACPGVLVEDKGQTLAIHFRQAPRFAAQVEKVANDALHYLGEGWAVQPGKMVCEIKPAGKDKGTTIAEFMTEPPFLGRTPVFIGDDVTDEYGFAIVNELGGLSVKVGGGATAARWRIDNVEAVRYWLGHCLMTSRHKKNPMETAYEQP